MNSGAWMPMLGQYGPHLFTMFENFTTLSRELVGEWLYKYMYEGDPTKKSQSKSLSDWLSNHEEFKSHGRHISREQLESRGIKITHLEEYADRFDVGMLLTPSGGQVASEGGGQHRWPELLKQRRDRFQRLSFSPAFWQFIGN